MVTKDDNEDDEDDVEGGENVGGSKGAPVGEEVTVYSFHHN